MAEVVPINSPFSFARGVVVRENGRAPNMLVVRDLGATVAVVRIEGDQAGSVRLREIAKDGLQVALGLDAGDPA